MAPKHLPLSRLALVCALALPLGLAACGGGGGGDGDGDTTTLVIESTGSLDGGVTVSGNGAVNSASSAAIPLVGDGAFQASGGTLVYTGLWSFDLSGIPSGAQIQSATLRLYQTSTAGDPASAFAIARMDHVNYGAIFPSTSSVNVIDFNFAQIGDLSTVGPKTVDATAQVVDDLAAPRARSQFRMRMAIQTDNDAEADWCVMTDQETPTDFTQRPQLIIEYIAP